jgi:alpha-N-acetylglucosaminidase
VYTFCIDAPQGSNINATYNGVAIEEGTEYMEDDLDIELFDATEIPGYTWSIVVDDENYTITLLYTEAPSVENPEAVVALVNRIGGTGTDEKFKFILDPSMNSKNEVFSINGDDGKVLVKGSTLSAITTGLGWYLNNIAKINIAWNSLNEKTVSGEAYADLSNIPVPTAEEMHTSDAKYRYYLNTCTFGYSMTSWTWKRWQQEIDWMALHGINMPLQLVGLEEVWRKFLTMEEGGKRKYGYTDEAAKAFVAGPAFIAWWAMNNLEGWGGTGSGTKSGGTWAGAGGVQDDAWYARQKNLAKQITDRQRELGMQPVLPGWSGMVPTNFDSKSGYATRGNGGNWAGDFVRPLLLNVNIGADKYAAIAADYYKCLKEVMGESQYYSMDPFHEGGGAGTMEDYKALYDAMEAAKAGSQWVIQQWQWSATQKYSLTAVPAGRLVVLDLFSDGSPAFDKYNGYAPQDAVFCAIPNFGGRSGLMGRLQNVTDNYFKFKGKYASIKGIGAAPEAIEQTPVTYDLIFQLPWMNGVKPNVAEWVGNYAVARYGQDNAVVKEAWNLLRQGPLNYGADGIQGPVEDVWAARPNLDAKPASFWGKTLNHAGGTYTKARRQMLIEATYKLLSQQEALGMATGSVYESNYNYDLIEFGGGVMADYAYDLLLGIKEAKNAGKNALYETRRDAFLQLILDVDKFKGTNLNFRLGKWTQEARDAAGEVTGATAATPDWYEYNNARTIVSTWSSPGTNLNDYSYRSWQGLMKDLYYPRWKHYFDNNCTTAEYKFFEWNWAHGMKHSVGQTAISNEPLAKGEAGHTDNYTRAPEGNTVDLAKEILGKYIIPVNNGEYYAYRYLNNDLTGKVTLIANAGTSIDLTQYFGALTGTVSGDFINGTATDLGSVAIKPDVADGSHIGTLTLTDGTVLAFAVVINPGYYGVYNINYKNGDEENAVFVGYNEDKDNSSNVGYKLIATGTYSADAQADKMFTIVPNGTGFSISAQGKFLKQPTLGGWNHLMFSDNADEAGAYIIEETGTDTGIFKIRSTGSGINYLNDYDKLVFGNDKSDKDNLATFTITEATSYPLTITSAGYATLCLPFNVVIQEGMLAYDLSVENIASGDAEDEYIATMKVVAKAGETLKKGTPVIIKANAGDYTLPITMSDNGAKTSIACSLLRGNFVEQNLTQGVTSKKYIFGKPEGHDVGFYLMNESGTIGANKCWMEWTIPAGQAEARSFIISFDNATGISDIITVTKESRKDLIYNIGGQRLNKPQKGLNIIGNKKVIIK